VRKRNLEPRERERERERDLSKNADAQVLGGVAGMMGFHKKHLASLSGGSLRKKTLTSEELKLLAAVPVCIINLASKPERSCVLAAMSVAEVVKWITSGGNLIRKQMKGSVKNKLVVLPSNDVVKQGLDFYINLIRPVLATGGKSTAHLDCKQAAYIKEEDVKRASELIAMPADDWCKFLVKHGFIIGGGRRAPSRWPLIYERSGPWNWDATLIKRKNRKVDYARPPTMIQLRIAVNTRANNSFLLDSNGDSMVRCGDSLSLICNKYGGVAMTPTLLRKLVTTEAKNQGKPMTIVDEALEHTEAVSEKHYRLKDMEVVGNKWAEIYDSGLDMTDMAAHFNDVATAPLVVPRNIK
jgi:hypothetical protein